MPYLEALAALAGAASIRSVSVRVALATAAGGLPQWLSPTPVDIGEGIAECAARAGSEAGVRLVPRACVGVRSDPGIRVSGPGDLSRQDIQVVVWATPPDTLAGQAAPAPDVPETPSPDPWLTEAMAGFAASGRPAFDGVTAVRVPDSYSADTYWRRLRRRIGHAPLVMPAVAALVLDERGDLLLVRTRTWDRWMIPGGAVELGETTADTAVRKAREETGLAVEPYAVLGAYTGRAFLTRYPNGDVTQHVSTPMLCRVARGPARRTVDEVLEVRAFHEGALPPMFPQWAAIARDALAGTLGRMR